MENSRKTKAILKASFIILFIGISFLLISSSSDARIKRKINTTVIPEVLLELENQDRIRLGIEPLEQNELLQQAAQKKAEDMAKRGYFAHTSPDGMTPWQWFKMVGYNFLYAGEILAVKFKSAESVEKAWMNSDPHKQNILNSRFTQTGIGIAKGEYKGVETEYVVQFFGTLMPSFESLYKLL